MNPNPLFTLDRSALLELYKGLGPFFGDSPDGLLPLGSALLDGSVQSTQAKAAPQGLVFQVFSARSHTLANGQLDPNLGWYDRVTALSAWALSAHLLVRHYGRVVLFTDNAGVQLATTLRLPYWQIRSHLNGVLDDDFTPNIARLTAIAAVQADSFLCVDNDTLLFEPLANVNVPFYDHIWGRDPVSQTYLQSFLELTNKIPVDGFGLKNPMSIFVNTAPGPGFLHADMAHVKAVQQALSWWYRQNRPFLKACRHQPWLILENLLIPAMLNERSSALNSALLPNRSSSYFAAHRGYCQFLGACKRSAKASTLLLEFMRQFYSGLLENVSYSLR